VHDVGVPGRDAELTPRTDVPDARRLVGRRSPAGRGRAASVVSYNRIVPATSAVASIGPAGLKATA
jgi:hypothetical protein